MRILVVAVGRLREKHLRAGCDDYLERLGRAFPTRCVEVKDADRRGSGDAERWRAREAGAILAAVPAGAHLVALDERGRTFDSRAFASWVGARRDEGVSTLAFAIGGPDGHGEGVLEVARTTLSLSPMTMPHELARLVLLEQLYRAASLLAGSPYHRD